MKKVISLCQIQVFTVILSLLILMMGSCTTAYAAKLGLASAWLFDDNGGKVVKDVVSGHNGEIKGSLEWVNNGKFGGALEFPGKGDSYVRVDHDDVFNSDPYSFVAWVKLEAASWQYIVWRNGDVWPEPEDVRHLDIWIHDADYPVFMWHVKGNVGRLMVKRLLPMVIGTTSPKSMMAKTFRCSLMGNWMARNRAAAHWIQVNRRSG